ncbi:hypothetical protein ACOSQ2_023696 [Xanthoceras sorbifolium]
MIALVTPYSKPTTTHRSISASISRPSIFLASGSHCLSLDITSSNNNMSPFLDHYIVATFFAFLFGFLLLFVLGLNNNKNNNMSPFLDHYIVATFFASLFGFLLLFVLRHWDEEMERSSPASIDLLTHEAVLSSPHACSHPCLLKVASGAPVLDASPISINKESNYSRSNQAKGKGDPYSFHGGKSIDQIVLNFLRRPECLMPSYLNKLVFPESFLAALRTIAMRVDEHLKVSSLLEELVGSGGERQPSDAEVKAAIWEACGDSGALQLLVDLLHAK